MFHSVVILKKCVYLFWSNECFSIHPQNFTGLFSKLSTLLQLWNYIRRFNEKIVDALEESEDAQADHLAFKMVEIEQTLANEDSTDEHGV